MNVNITERRIDHKFRYMRFRNGAMWANFGCLGLGGAMNALAQIKAALRRSFVIAGALLAVSGASLAAEIPGSQFNNSGWTGAAYSSDSDGSFSHCAMSATYNSGITLIFAISQNAWAMDLYDSAWNLQTGQTYPVAYSVDGGPTQQASATAMGAQGVEIQLPVTEGMMNLFRYGNRLTIYAASQTLSFNLSGTSSALYALGACAISRTSLAASNPFGTSNPFLSMPSANVSDKSASESVAALQAEATALAANLLGQTGTTFHFLPPDQIPESMKSYKAVWQTSDTFGAINVVPASAGIGISTQCAALIADDSASCKGKFASGSVPDNSASNGKVVRVFTACDGPDGFNAYYQIVSRQKGGFYLIAIGASASSATAAQESDNHIRSAVLQFLSE